MTRRDYLIAAALLGAVGCGGNPPVSDDDDGPDASNPDAVVPIDAGTDAPTDASPDAWAPVVPPEIDGRLVINEFMANNVYTLPAASGPGLDWIELYNPTDTAIPLQGYALTDDLAVPRKAPIGAGVTIPPRSRLVLWADDNPGAGPTHLGFHLATEGGSIGLSRPDGSYLDRVTYGDQSTDFSAAREPDGSNLWRVQWLATPGAVNNGTGGQPIGVEVPTAPPEAVPAAGDLSERLLGYDALPSIALTISPEGIASLRAQPLVSVPAQITFAGRTYGQIGVRLKGQNSFQPIDMKPSLRLHIDKYNDDARFFGLKDMTLNNMDNDLSMMHERLAYYVARQAGIPASRATHALLTINGQFYGLYLNLETVKKKMVGRWFANDTGSLFEATDVDFAPSYVSQFALEAGPDDRTMLTGLANALTNPSADAAIAAAGNFANMDQFRRFWAMCSLIGQFDSFPFSAPGDDFLVYADPTSQRLSFIPWGMDETFYSGSLNPTTITSSVMARKCLDSPACFQAYVDEVWALQTMTESIGLAAERDRVIAQIAPHVAADLRKPYTNEQVAESQGALYWFIHERRANLGTMLPPPSAGQ